MCPYCSGQLLQLHRGQGKDIYWRDSYLCPTEEEYREMVRQSELHSSTGLGPLIIQYFGQQKVVSCFD